MRAVAAPALLAAVASVCTLVAAGQASASSSSKDPPATTEGRLATRDGKQVVDVPLEHTEVRIRADGLVAQVEVEQTFRNPYDRKIEAVYLFPLPTGAAVNDLEIQIGERVVKGDIAKKEDAKATYVKARKAGFVATLLTQERPNLFTQNLANLEPGARVLVRLRYVETLAYADGAYEIVFPMVAGPRFVPAAAKTAAGADSVQPTVLPEGLRSSHDIGLTVDIDAGVPLRGVASTSHRIVESKGDAPSRTRVTLAAGDTIPNKDFVLRYDVAGDAPQMAVLAHRAGGTAEGSFFLTLQPPRDVAPAAVTAREIVFVLDTSSSMRGRPLAKARELVRQMLTTLGPDDTFQMVRFADSASALGPAPIASKPKNVEYALAWMDALSAGGGTAMTEGIAAALDFPHDPARLRLVVFVTDGYVGNEDEILATVHARLGDARLYSFGVGTAVNRYLLEEMAAFGRGGVQVVRPDEDTTAAVGKFLARVARPVLTDVRIDWGGLAVADVTPAAVPDLFVGQPIVVAGHYARAGAAKIVVHGRAGGRDVQFEVAVDLPERAERPAIATVWARARIAELARQEIRGASAATREEITRIALAHRLMSPYTAFVAVDRSRTTAGGEAKKVAVPVEVPDGLHATGEGGGGAGYGTIGTGSYGIVGYGSGGGGSYGVSDGYGVSSGHGGMAPRVAVLPAPALGAAPAPAPAASETRDDLAKYKDAFVGNKAALRRLFLAHSGSAGRYVLRFEIAASGAVTKVEVTKKPAVDGADALAAAMVAEARKWHFPAGSSDTVVSYPILFEDKK